MKSINVCGDILSVEWNGNVWVAPSTGQQFGMSADALAVELREYLSASGESTDHIDGQYVIDHYDTVES